MTPLAEQTLASFIACNSWEQRSRLVLQAASLLPTYPEALRTSAHLVEGCTAKVWLSIQSTTPELNYLIDSEARLLKGLLALMHIRINGLSPGALQRVDLLQWYQQLGLNQQLTPSRANGLHTVFQQLLAHSLS